MPSHASCAAADLYDQRMPLLAIVRHGQASFGTDDYDRLSGLGRIQAERTATALSAAGLDVSRIISGSLRRQQDTATALADAYGLTPSVDERWNEYAADPVLEHHSSSAQRLEHPSSADALPTSPREFQAVLERALEDWVSAGADSPTPETWPQFHDRVRAALEAAGTAGPGTTVVVSSGGVIGAIAVGLLGVDPVSFPRLNRVTINCGITRVIFGSAGKTLVSFNEQGHLAVNERTYR
jgi:broad specificity phosphatase PhoE